MARHDPIDYVGIRDIRHLGDLSALDLADPVVRKKTPCGKSIFLNPAYLGRLLRTARDRIEFLVDKGYFRGVLRSAGFDRGPH